jgi:hypothetical protein
MIKVWSTYPPALWTVPATGSLRIAGGTVTRVQVDGVDVPVDSDLPEGFDLGWLEWQRPAVPKPVPPRTKKVKGSTGKMYTLTMQPNGKWSCECPGYQFRRFCKHTGAK